jgi:formylmethanofuran dehydrogenase subunit E
MFLLLETKMDPVCQYCGELIVENAHRVRSEEEGTTLLDMIVCSLCFNRNK